MENQNNEKYPERLQDFLETLSLFNNYTDRVSFLIEYAERFKRVPADIATTPYPHEHRVEFCESGAFVWTQKQPDNTFKFYFDVENPQGVSAMALSQIFDDTLSGEKAEDILGIPDDIVYNIFGQNLSMGKNLGLTGILLAMKRDVKRLSNIN